MQPPDGSPPFDRLELRGKNALKPIEDKPDSVAAILELPGLLPDARNGGVQFAALPWRQN